MMLRYMMIAAAALCLAACDSGPVASPGTTPNYPQVPNTKPGPGEATLLDERLGLAATAAYTLASEQGRKWAEAGLIDVEAFKAADQRGFTAVKLVRNAYLAGNAISYAAAIRAAYKAAADINGLKGGQ